LKTKKIIPYLILTFFYLNVVAQQTPQFSLFHKLYSYSNPAFTASEGASKVGALHRTQWAGYDTNVEPNPRPISQLISFELPISFLSPFSKSSITKEKNEGLGINLLNDNIGVINQISLQLSLAKRIKLSESQKLSFGIGFGLISQTIRNSNLNSVEPNDPAIEELLNSNLKIEPSLSTGLWFLGEKSNFGISFNNLLSDDGGNTIISQKNLIVDFNRSFTISSSLDLIPMFNYITDFKNHSNILGLGTRSIFMDIKVEFNLLLRQSLSKDEEGQIQWSNNDAIVQIGMPSIASLPISFYYSIDVVTFDASAKSNYSHEIMLVYLLRKNRGVNAKQLYSPRYKYE